MLAAVARRVAAKVMVSLSKADQTSEAVSESVSDGLREVVIIIRPVRFGVGRDLDMDALRRELADRFGLEARPLERSETASPLELRNIHRRLLRQLTSKPASLRTLARSLTLSSKSGHLRTALAELVRWELVRKSEGGYSLP